MHLFVGGSIRWVCFWKSKIQIQNQQRSCVCNKVVLKCYQDKESDSLNVGTICLDNTKTRKIVDQIDVIIDLCIPPDDPQYGIANKEYKECFQYYRDAMSIARKHEDLHNEEILEFQRNANIFFRKWVDLEGYNGMTNYIHLMGSGHLSEYMFQYRNLFDFGYIRVSQVPFVSSTDTCRDDSSNNNITFNKIIQIIADPICLQFEIGPMPQSGSKKFYIESSGFHWTLKKGLKLCWVHHSHLRGLRRYVVGRVNRAQISLYPLEKFSSSSVGLSTDFREHRRLD
jgi:hypothetical protein